MAAQRLHHFKAFITISTGVLLLVPSIQVPVPRENSHLHQSTIASSLIKFCILLPSFFQLINNFVPKLLYLIPVSKLVCASCVSLYSVVRTFCLDPFSVTHRLLHYGTNGFNSFDLCNGVPI